MKLPLALTAALTRKKLGLHTLSLDRFEVGTAHTVDDYEQAFQLVHAAYVFQGIEVNIGGQALRMTPQHVLAESTILLAHEKERPVGTLTVTLDSPAQLPLDDDYPRELAALRKAGATLVEYGSLMVVRRCWQSGVAHLLNMTATNFASNLLGGTHVVAGIHPRALPLYAGLFGLRPIGKVRRHSHLHAPVQGMVGEFASIQRFMAKHHRRPMMSGQRPVDHFFGELPSCIKRPPISSLEDLRRWKLPREVFQEMFIHRSDHLKTLDGRTRAHLRAERSWRTLEVSV
ncbi:MAG: hypothetical protein JRH20_08290 [Deltaproteobacteria bacterium]|nr:hypothetical protein [Deltaproteobacteria bacterium]